MNSKIVFISIAALLSATACSNDVMELENQGHEITFNTSVSRANNLATSNLKEFKVWAFSDLVDSEAFINGLTVTKPAGKDYFTFDHSIFWPSDVATLNFWAVAPTSTEGIVSENKKLQLKDYTPKTDPMNQEDLIVAYKKANRVDGTNIALKFNHALSQIVIRAKAGVEGDESKNVKIKGAWIVNAAANGNLSSSDGTTLTWAPNTTTKTSFGKDFNTEVTLDHTLSSILDFDPNEDNIENAQTNLLVIPQTVDKWDPATDEDNNSKKAYILLLCRVETTHDGALHDGFEDKLVQTVGNKHTHQLFPITDEFNPEEYGYTCVPVEATWEPGKRYIYNLTFCGATSGAGIYPPSAGLQDKPDGDGENNNYIKKRPDGKKQGDPVLDNPITFTVEVENWTDMTDGEGSTTWTDGNINMN